VAHQWHPKGPAKLNRFDVLANLLDVNYLGRSASIILAGGSGE